MIRPKISLFIILCAAFAVCSCNKENDVIPDVYVDFYIDIKDARFVSELSSMGSSIVVDQDTNNDPYAGGFGGSGIIITTGAQDDYFAYDRTCPYDYSLDGSIIKVIIDQTLFATAICPKCHSSFNLFYTGQPSSGPSQNYLKNYTTALEGRFIHVWNK